MLHQLISLITFLEEVGWLVNTCMFNTCAGLWHRRPGFIATVFYISEAEQCKWTVKSSKKETRKVWRSRSGSVFVLYQYCVSWIFQRDRSRGHETQNNRWSPLIHTAKMNQGLEVAKSKAWLFCHLRAALALRENCSLQGHTVTQWEVLTTRSANFKIISFLMRCALLYSRYGYNMVHKKVSK